MKVVFTFTEDIVWFTHDAIAIAVYGKMHSIEKHGFSKVCGELFYK